MAEIPVNITTNRPVIAANLEQLRFLVFQGMKGDTGQSAYELAVSLGFPGSEQDWLDSLKGLRGEPGEPGPRGERGELGPIGPAGKDGKNYGIVVDGSTDNVLELKSVEASGSDVAVDPTLTIEGEAADAAVTGEAIRTIVSDNSRASGFDPRWWIGKSITGSGVGTSSYMAITAEMFDAANTYTYTGAKFDSDDNRLVMYVGEYDSNFKFLGRTSMNLSSDNVTVPFNLAFTYEDCAYFRLSFGRATGTGVEFTESDLDYFSMICVKNKLRELPEDTVPATSNDSGVIGGLYDIAEGYLNYAYQDGDYSGLLYSSVNAEKKDDDDGQHSAYSPTISKYETEDYETTVDQYTIQCSGLANLMLRAVAFQNSRYTLGNSGENISYPWGYHFEDDTQLASASNHGILWTYNLLRYAVDHGFAYQVNQNADNIRPGDLLFVTRPGKETYQEIGHVMTVLAVGADGCAVIFDATSGLKRESGGTEYDVGIRTAILDIKNQSDIVFGARFPLGSMAYEPEVVYRTSDVAAGTYAASEAIRAFTSAAANPQGLYTVAAKGSFSAPPVVAVMYSGDEVYTQLGAMLQSGDVYTLPIYAERPFTGLALLAPAADTVVGDVEQVAVGHGYLDLDALPGEYKFEITMQPINACVPLGSPARFVVEAVGNGLKYKWEYKRTSDTTWKSSSVANHVYATTINAEKNGMKVRCTVTDTNGDSAVSNEAVASTLAVVANTGSYNDLSDKPAAVTGLPAVTAADEGKVLKVNSSGAWGVGTDETGNMSASWVDVASDLSLSAGENVSAVSLKYAYYCAALGLVRFAVAAMVPRISTATPTAPGQIEISFDAASKYKPRYTSADFGGGYDVGVGYGSVSGVYDTEIVPCQIVYFNEDLTLSAETHRDHGATAQLWLSGFYYTEDIPTAGGEI